MRRFLLALLLAMSLSCASAQNNKIASLSLTGTGLTAWSTAIVGAVHVNSQIDQHPENEQFHRDARALVTIANIGIVLAAVGIVWFVHIPEERKNENVESSD